MKGVLRFNGLFYKNNALIFTKQQSSNDYFNAHALYFEFVLVSKHTLPYLLRSIIFVEDV